MANLVDCITNAVAVGRMSVEEGQEFARRIENHEKALTLSGEMSPEAATMQAERAVFDAARAEVALQ